MNLVQCVSLHEDDFKLNPARKYSIVDGKYKVSRGSFILLLLCNKNELRFSALASDLLPSKSVLLCWSK